MASQATQMGDKVLPPSDSRGTGQGPRGKVPLSVSTARVDSKAGWTPRGSQSSPVVRSAQPPSPPRRSTSDPHTTTYSSSSSFSSTSDNAPPYGSSVRAATTPKSAGFKDSMGFGGKGPKSPIMGGRRRKSGGDVSVTAHRRRSSNEGKANVHTECGRHGDQWLLGGWKKIFVKEEAVVETMNDNAWVDESLDVGRME